MGESRFQLSFEFNKIPGIFVKYPRIFAEGLYVEYIRRVSPCRVYSILAAKIGEARGCRQAGSGQSNDGAGVPDKFDRFSGRTACIVFVHVDAGNYFLAFPWLATDSIAFFISSGSPI